MLNRLANENSPYLLQHASNPVYWYPWCEEALSLARTHDKPIFLSVGYAACHWCHVMAHESFEDSGIAEILNNNFINIKVDREERPDIDSIYMNAVVALTGQGGWPLSVFLTPEGKPFFGGTYFPPTSRYNMPAFRNVLLSVIQAWQSARNQIDRTAEQIADYLRSHNSLDTNEVDLKPVSLKVAVANLIETYDWENGGWGNAPKFPQAMVIEFLIRQGFNGDGQALEIALHALDAMAKGGMYDLVGGGFARYSTDDRWLIPHFEKMLYDNALLARTYLHAFLVTGMRKYEAVTRDTLNFIAREMTNSRGGFFSSLDADSEGVEGKYYVWKYDQIKAALSHDEFALACDVYGISEQGNFEGSNVLQKVLSHEEISKHFSMTLEEVTSHLSKLNLKLMQVRDSRVRPVTDDKCLVAWNALVSITFSEYGRYVGDRYYVKVATRNLNFLIDELHRDGQLLRSWRNGKAQHKAYLEDYAALVNALLVHYQTDPDPKWFTYARNLADEMLLKFSDGDGLLYDTSSDQDNLITRPRDIQDNATPCGNSLAASALLALSHFTGSSAYTARLRKLLARISDVSSKHPIAFGNWLCAMDWYLHPGHEVVIIGNNDHPNTSELIDALWSKYRPNLVAVISDGSSTEGTPPLLAERSLIDGLPTAFVCRQFVCSLPTNSVSEFLNQLDPENNAT